MRNLDTSFQSECATEASRKLYQEYNEKAKDIGYILSCGYTRAKDDNFRLIINASLIGDESPFSIGTNLQQIKLEKLIPKTFQKLPVDLRYTKRASFL